jgi:hypothetical protein
MDMRGMFWRSVTACVALLLAVPTWAAQQGGDTGTLSTGGGGGYTDDPALRYYGVVLRGSSYYNQREFLGLAAKGNIVIGDYRNWRSVSHPVNEMIDHDGLNDVTQAYPLLDATDAALGYANAPASVCDGKSPCFDGDYTKYDSGVRCASGETPGTCTGTTPRRFYESALSDEAFGRIVSGKLENPIACFSGEPAGHPCTTSEQSLSIEATFYTNHAFIGDVGRSSWYGAWVSRDEALRFQGRFDMNYDWRLQDPDFRKQIHLPMIVAPTTVTQWQEVPPQ